MTRNALRVVRRLGFWLAVCVPLSAQAGLDVIAFERLELVVSPRPDRAAGPWASGQLRLVPTAFPERFEGLTPGGTYRYAASFEFRAGPYSSYGAWRNELARLAGYAISAGPGRNGAPEARYDVTASILKRGPFWELIDFSDAEGVIGPRVCRRVLKDFVAFDAAASRHPQEEFRRSYSQWKKAFSLCANDGAIVFH